MGVSLLCVGKRIHPLLLTQVHVLEDDDARLHIRNLSLHRCDTEEQALNMVGGRGYHPPTCFHTQTACSCCNSEQLCSSAASHSPPTPCLLTLIPPQLFLGDTNRVVAETPLNLASSRSHCVFTVHIEARRAGEAVVRRSKLNFVDLAGSERVVKTGMSASMQLREAKYINLSLHFLEQVSQG